MREPSADASKARLRRLLSEPLLHFLVIGALVFAGISLAHQLQRPTIRIDASDLDQLAAYWEQQMQRPPTKAELSSLIQERIDEELLAREAVRLGLDKDDMIVRRRLAQKMEFASDDSATREPSEAELRAYFAAHQDRYATPDRLALRQVYFSADRTGERPEIAAAEALSRLSAGQTAAGDPSLLPTNYADVSVRDLERDYGPAFEEAARQAKPGTWVGPIASPYGVHLLRVEARMAPQVPAFESVRAEVHAAWLADQRQKGHEAFLRKLRDRYRLVVAGPGQ